MELQVLEQNVIVQAFATQGGSLLLVDRIAEEVRKHVPDVTTKKGRDAIGSLAAKVSKSKTIAEKYAKDLVAEEKARIKLVDDDRIQFVKRMDALRDEILAPRDAWEQAEKDRVAKHEHHIATIRMVSTLATAADSEWTALTIKEAIETLENRVIDSSFEEYEEQAKLAKFETLEVLRKALGVREKYEAEQAELERLRLAEQARLQQEREAQIAREAAEKATREAEEKARFEAERVQREKFEAEQREARLKAEKEQVLIREEQLKQKVIDDAKQAEIDKQEAIEAERQKIEFERLAKEEAERKAEQARLANVEHMRKINNDVLSAIVQTGITEEQAKAIIKMIAKNEVPHVKINY